MSSDHIAMFDMNRKEWKTLGKMIEARNGHGVIFHKGHFIVVGGINTQIVPKFKYDDDKRTTERCELQNRGRNENGFFVFIIFRFHFFQNFQFSLSFIFIDKS